MRQREHRLGVTRRPVSCFNHLLLMCPERRTTDILSPFSQPQNGESCFFMAHIHSPHSWLLWESNKPVFVNIFWFQKRFPFHGYPVSLNLSVKKFSMLILSTLISFSLETLLACVWSELLLVYRRLFFFWEGCSAVCLLLSGSSISEGSPG